MRQASRILALAAALAAVCLPARGQTSRRIAFRAVDYDVTATLSPADQLLTGRARVEFEAREASRYVDVELHPNLKITQVLGSDGKPLNVTRDDNAPLQVRVTLPEPATAGQKFALTFEYVGPLANEENSPVKGVRLASINLDTAYLLLPARWFPLTDYPSNRYTATFRIEVPDDFTVAGTGTRTGPTAAVTSPLAPAPGKAGTPARSRVVYTFKNTRPLATGSFVAGSLQQTPVSAEGLKISVFARTGAPGVQAYGEAAGRMINGLSDLFGALPEPNLTLAWMPDGSVQGFAGPGLVLISQRQWDPKVNARLLTNLIAQQWWGVEVQPASPADVWVTDGLARYSEALYLEQSAGKEGMNRALEEFAVGALMYEDAAPIAQANRLDPFTSEYRSVVMNKGAMVFHMLRAQLGDDTFHALVRDFYGKFTGKSARNEDFTKMAQERASAAAGGSANLTPFFTQWLNSTGIPEFKTDYVIYRTPKGFQVVGKIKQDLETFRLPVDVKVVTEGNPEFKTIQVVGTSSDFALDTFGRPKPGGIIIDPNNHLLKSSPRLRVLAAVARGEELAEEGRFYDAIQQYQHALELQKNNSLAHFRMGEAFFFQKNYQAAANAFREAVDGDLDLGYKWVEVWSRIYIGKIFDISGQRERAVNEYRRAQETNDDTGGAQAEIAKLLQTPYKEDTGTRPANQ